MSADCVSVLLADANPDFRELLINHLLMSGVERIGVATGAGELIESLPGTEYDLIVLSYRIFDDERTKQALCRYRKTSTGAIIVLLEDEGEELTVHALKSIDAQVCLLRSNASKVLKRLVTA